MGFRFFSESVLLFFIVFYRYECSIRKINDEGEVVMSWKLARKDMSLLIRNPITYLGIIFMIWIVVFTVSPFWNLYGNVRDEKSSVVYDSEGR